MSQNVFKIIRPPLQLDKLEHLDLHKLFSDPEVKEALRRANADYLPWAEIRYKDWIPDKFFSDKELFWTALTLQRYMTSSPTPIRDAQGNYFRINGANNYKEFLHIVDKEMAGNYMGIADFSESDKKRFIARNLIEESIASSQLEGANTSREVAKRMLLEGRQPQDHSQQMIVNNYQTMLKIEEGLCKEPLSLPLICQLHAMITDKTIAADKQGKLRDTLDEKGNRLKVMSSDGQSIAYIAPDREFVEAELPRLIDFSNDKNQNDVEFIHPLIKGIMLHFWIGLLHPFEDGNGRLARTLFYWYMLKKEYWAFAYLSLSEKIKKSRTQYSMAYIYSEQDNSDLTYFIHYNVNKLKLAADEFQQYIKKKVDENRLAISQQELGFNIRQIKLLQYLNHNLEEHTNVVTHQKLYAIKKGTAIADLRDLVERGLLVKRKFGRNVFYYATNKVGWVLRRR